MSGSLLAFFLLTCLASSSTPYVVPAQSSNLEVKGRLEPRRFVELSVLQPGRIESVLAAEGDHVATGDLLARLDGYETLSAEVDAARLELVLAQQALDELERTAGLRLAETTLAMRQAEKDARFAADRLASLQRPTPVMDIQAARANLMLAEKSLEKRRKDLRIARHLYDDHNDIAWYFINRGPYRQYLAALEKSWPTPSGVTGMPAKRWTICKNPRTRSTCRSPLGSWQPRRRASKRPPASARS